MKYKVEKNKHKFWPRPLLDRFANKSISFKAVFRSNCIYNFGDIDDQLDINKLYGLTSLKIHKNSARIGWRPEGNVIRVFAYWYIAGVRGWKSLGHVQPNIENIFKVSIKNNNYNFAFNDEELHIPITKKWYSIFTFKSYPYFGGNLKAPHAMDIEIRDIHY